MSRSLDDSIEASSASRERVVRKRATTARVRTEPARRTRASRGVEKPPENSREETVVVDDVRNSVQADVVEKRKAPTNIAETKVVTMHKKRQMIIVSTVLICGIGASAVVGFSNEGQIDVQKTIESRNERIRNNQASESDLISSTVEVPVQNTSVKADGGLVGRGVGSAPKPAAPAPEADSATSSMDIATSSDAVSTTTEPVPTDDSTSDESVSDEESEVSETTEEEIL